MKDLLVNDCHSWGGKPDYIEHSINAEPSLALAADLANLDKHGKLDRRPRSGYVPKITRASSVSVPGGWRMRLVIEHGSDNLDALDVAREAVAAWNRVLSGFGLS